MRGMRVIGLCILAIAAGCAQLSFRQPSTALAAVELAELGLEGGAVRLGLDVHNPNAYELRTTRIAVGLVLEGIHFGEAALTEVTRLPAGGTARVSVPVRFTWAGVGAGGRALLSRGAVRYRLTGTLTLGTPLGDRDVALDREGEARLTDGTP